MYFLFNNFCGKVYVSKGTGTVPNWLLKMKRRSWLWNIIVPLFSPPCTPTISDSPSGSCKDCVNLLRLPPVRYSSLRSQSEAEVHRGLIPIQLQITMCCPVQQNGGTVMTKLSVFLEAYYRTFARWFCFLPFAWFHPSPKKKIRSG